MWPWPAPAFTILMLVYQLYAWGYDGHMLSWWIVFLPLYLIPAICTLFVGSVVGFIVITLILAVITEICNAIVTGRYRGE
jgi:hypothetical protein